MAAGAAYQLATEIFFDLEAIKFITGHSEIAQKEVTGAILSAMS